MLLKHSNITKVMHFFEEKMPKNLVYNINWFNFAGVKMKGGIARVCSFLSNNGLLYKPVFLNL